MDVWQQILKGDCWQADKYPTCTLVQCSVTETLRIALMHDLGVELVKTNPYVFISFCQLLTVVPDVAPIS